MMMMQQQHSGSPDICAQNRAPRQPALRLKYAQSRPTLLKVGTAPKLAVQQAGDSTRVRKQAKGEEGAKAKIATRSEH